MMKYIFLLLTAIVFVGCAKDSSDSGSTVPSRRTIMIYFNAESTNISNAAYTDLSEIESGAKSLPDDCNILLFFDNYGVNTTIYRFTKNGRTTVKDYGADINASDPGNMLDGFQTMIQTCPASEYVTVFWGHGTGPQISTKIISSGNAKGVVSGNNTTAYGTDCGSSITWINIPEMSNILSKLPKQNIIMFDACLLQSVEVAYELKDYADYIVGSCSETPTSGAPYKEMVAAMSGYSIEQTAKDMVNTYIDKNTWGTTDNLSDGICISAVKTSALKNLMEVTRSAIDTIKTYSTTCPLNLNARYSSYPDVQSCIFYFFTTDKTDRQPLYYDMNDVMLHNLCTEHYNTWKNALDNAVIEKRHPRDITLLSGYICDWVPATFSKSTFKRFLLDDTTYGGLSMYVPREIYNSVTSPNMNQTMYQYKWYNEIGWNKKGW